MVENTPKSRVIQEYVPGRQVTLAHVIAKPNRILYKKLGLSDDYREAIGILTITPAEGAIIASDICVKYSAVELGFIDRFSGSVVIVGELSAVETALSNSLNFMESTLSIDVCKITRS